ncbi:hypothetical protein ABFT80_11485 [Mesorhizobium sp. SB112]|uniref:hypothetical protein n=1 Tax=Mesorhizobium sp. SB112 TaxID=3151853 RepID=UPI0032658A2F
MERRIKNPDYPGSPIVQAAELIILVSHPTAVQKYALKPSLWARIKGRRAEWTWAAIKMYGDAGKMVAILPPAYYAAGCEELGLNLSTLLDERTFPSTGYFGIRYALEHFPADEWDVEIAGFGWQGWHNHTWDPEREWVARRAGERNIKIWPAGEESKPKYAKKDRYSRKKA